MIVNSKMAEIVFRFCMCFRIWVSGLKVCGALSVGKATWVENMFFQKCLPLLLPDTPKGVTSPEPLLILITLQRGSQPSQVV